LISISAALFAHGGVAVVLHVQRTAKYPGRKAFFGRFYSSENASS